MIIVEVGIAKQIIRSRNARKVLDAAFLEFQCLLVWKVFARTLATIALVINQRNIVISSNVQEKVKIVKDLMSVQDNPSQNAGED